MSGPYPAQFAVRTHANAPFPGALASSRTAHSVALARVDPVPSASLAHLPCADLTGPTPRPHALPPCRQSVTPAAHGTQRVAGSTPPPIDLPAAAQAQAAPAPGPPNPKHTRKVAHCRGKTSSTWRAPCSAARTPSPPWRLPQPPGSPHFPPQPPSRPFAPPSTTASSASCAPRSPTSPTAALPTRRRGASSRSPWRTARGSSGCASAPPAGPMRSRSTPPCSTAPRSRPRTRPSSAASSRSSAGCASTSASSSRSPGPTTSSASSAPPGPTTSPSATSSPSGVPMALATVVDATSRSWRPGRERR